MNISISLSRLETKNEYTKAEAKNGRIIQGPM
jgi:hypothetical protein